MAYAVILAGGSPWGFRLSGGVDFNEPLKIGKLNPNSKAYNQGVKVGDYLDKINGTQTSNLEQQDALQLIRNANDKLELELRRTDQVKKKRSTIPEIRINGPPGGSDHLNGNTSDSDYYYSSCDEGDSTIVRTNALNSYSHSSSGSAGHQSDGDGSSSGSQSSVVHVVAPYKGPLADKMKNLSNSTNGTAASGSGRATPHTTVWSPFGVNKVRSYKPVSFSSQGSVTSPPPTTNQQPAFNVPSSFASTPQHNVARTQPDFVNRQPLGNSVNVDQNISVSIASPSSERKDIGHNGPSDSPSYSNFNGSSSVVVSTPSPGAAYTSITMNSRKDLSEDLKLNNNSISSPFSPGSPFSPSSPFSPTSYLHKSPTTSSTKSDWSPSEVTSLIDAELRDRERERGRLQEEKREKQRLRDHEAELELRKSPSVWGNKSPSDLYTPVHLDTQLDQLTRGKPDGMKAESPSMKPEESFAWKPDRISGTVTTTTTTTASHHTPSTNMSFSGHNGSISHHQESKTGLPTYQSPTITLLQKSRDSRKNGNNNIVKDMPAIPADIQTIRINENDIPGEAVLVGSKEVVEGNQTHHDTYYYLPGEQKPTQSHRRVEHVHMKYDGIGPTDENTGIPIVPRGSVDSKMHKDWYKRMYQSLHKSEKKDDDRMAFSDSEDINNYRPTYVFPDNESESEVEEGPGSTRSMDRGGYGKRAFTLPNAKYRNEKYKVQPMSIENYEPGFSSIALRERKATDPSKPAEKLPEKKPTSPEKKPTSSEKKSTPPTKPERNGDKKSYLYNPPIDKPGQFSRYIYSDSEPDLKKSNRPLSPQSDIEAHDLYKRIQQGGEIPYEGLRFPVPPKKEPSHEAPQNIPRQRHSVSGTGRSPTGSWDTRRRRDEEQARRKEEMRRITAEERMKRMEQERRSNEARRHNDFLTDYMKDKVDDKYWLKLAGVEGERDTSPAMKSPIPLNRYDDEVPDVSDLQRPNKKMSGSYRGRGKAVYNFKAQNNKELSFRRGDVIYLTRQIDKNWYEGEHHGMVGIFPVNYVEVLMSLEDARTAAIHREGQAKAKYNFNSQTNNEVSFKKGDVVSLVRRIDNNWFEGRVDGRHGIFPVSYVEVFREPDTPLPTPMSSYATTPAGTGSPGQLSPVSTMSIGPAPTIPSAPISPRSSIDNFDFGAPFNFNQFSSASLQRGSGREQSLSDYGLDPLNMMRPASAMGGMSGMSDSYSTSSRDRGDRDRDLDRYNPANRPSSAVPFTDYGRSSTRDSGFYSSEESRHTRQRREEDLMRSLSNPYEGRSPSRQPEPVSRAEEPRYPSYQAMYTYRPQNPDELELREGDVVLVMEKCDDDWYVGTSQRTKEFGTFPGNYVKPL